MPQAKKRSIKGPFYRQDDCTLPVCLYTVTLTFQLDETMCKLCQSDEIDMGTFLRNFHFFRMLKKVADSDKSC